MRVLITGCDGQVGGQLVCRAPSGVCVLAIARQECDLTDRDQIRKTVRHFRPSVIINPAAFTAVDLAESQRDLAFAVNEAAPRVLAEEAKAIGAIIVHYSTDYVFDGSAKRPWAESDTPNPLNVYGHSKLAGERAVIDVGGRFLIFRTSWVYGPVGKNFFLSMLKLGTEKPVLRIVGDQIGAPTTSIQIAEATWRVVSNVIDLGNEFPSGLYHLTAAGKTSWCGFARGIFERVSKGQAVRFCDVEEISSYEYPTTAKRPLQSVLDNSLFRKTFGFRLESWEDGLSEVIEVFNARRACTVIR